MSAPVAMKRKRDGIAVPYSETVVRAHPGEYVELSWDGKAWTEGRPLAAPPAPPPVPVMKVSPLDGVEKPRPARVEVEPDTAAKPKRAKKGREA